MLPNKIWLTKTDLSGIGTSKIPKLEVPRHRICSESSKKPDDLLLTSLCNNDILRAEEFAQSWPEISMRNLVVSLLRNV